MIQTSSQRGRPRRRWRIGATAASIALTAVALLASAPSIALAQPASAIGQPLPEPSLPTGTITVKVVEGAASKTVTGAEATLVVNGTPRTARTDASGRATFSGLPAGATVQATIKDAEGKDASSVPFPVPANGGARVMLTTKPFAGAEMPRTPAAPAGHGAGAQGGMPEARQVSGQPQPDQNIKAGTFKVRLSYNNLVMKDGRATDPEPPVGETATLVGYRSDNTVDVRTAQTGPDGVAQFEELDISGNTSYFVMTRLPRAGKADRLMASRPITPDPNAGWKVVLSSHKRAGTEPRIDDVPQTSPVPPGKITVLLEGEIRDASEVSIVDAVTGAVVGKGQPKMSAEDPSSVESDSRFQKASDLAAKSLAVFAHGGARRDGPLQDIEVRIVPATGEAPADAPVGKTNKDGVMMIAVVAPGQHKAVYTVNGKQFESKPFDVSKGGGRLEILARWNPGNLQLTVDVPYDAKHVLYAEMIANGHRQRSLPFQTLEDVGTQAVILVLDRLQFRFHLESFVEDQYLAVRGAFAFYNNSWIPYRETPDGTLIRLPRGHTGGIVGARFQDEVTVVPTEGFRLLRPIPPAWVFTSPKAFEGGFTLVSDEGAVDWRLDLPFGTAQSTLMIRNYPGMRVKHPPSVKGEQQEMENGAIYYVLNGIDIVPGQSMAMRITGLPKHAPWKKWMPRVIGIAVIAMMLAGVAFAVLRPRPKVAQTTRRAKLMDELVELERTGGDPKRRDQVLAELEQLWD